MCVLQLARRVTLFIYPSKNSESLVPSAVGIARWSTLRHARRTTTQYTLQTSRSFRGRTRDNTASREHRGGFSRIFRRLISKRFTHHVPRPFERATTAVQLIGTETFHLRARNWKENTRAFLRVMPPRGRVTNRLRRLHLARPLLSRSHSHARFSLFAAPSYKASKRHPTHPHNAASHAQDKQPSIGMLPFSFCSLRIGFKMNTCRRIFYVPVFYLRHRGHLSRAAPRR